MSCCHWHYSVTMSAQAPCHHVPCCHTGAFIGGGTETRAHGVTPSHAGQEGKIKSPQIFGAHSGVGCSEGRERFNISHTDWLILWQRSSLEPFFHIPSHDIKPNVIPPDMLCCGSVNKIQPLFVNRFSMIQVVGRCIIVSRSMFNVQVKYHSGGLNTFHTEHKP